MIWTVILSLMPSVGPQVYLLTDICHIKIFNIQWKIYNIKVFRETGNEREKTTGKRFEKLISPSTVLHPSALYKQTWLQHLQQDAHFLSYIIYINKKCESATSCSLSDIYNIYVWYILTRILKMWTCNNEGKHPP